MTATNSDFASLLEDLFVAAEKPEEGGGRPTIPFDYLAVADELHSGRIRVSDTAAAAEYRSVAEGVEAELAALLDELAVEAATAEQRDTVQTPEEIAPETLSVEPEEIAVELGLDTARPADLGQLRRAFALKNHPDRVPPLLRQRALQRMQVANVLIDEARRRALPKARR